MNCWWHTLANFKLTLYITRRKPYLPRSTHSHPDIRWQRETERNWLRVSERERKTETLYAALFWHHAEFFRFSAVFSFFLFTCRKQRKHMPNILKIMSMPLSLLSLPLSLPLTLSTAVSATPTWPQFTLDFNIINTHTHTHTTTTCGAVEIFFISSRGLSLSFPLPSSLSVSLSLSRCRLMLTKTICKGRTWPTKRAVYMSVYLCELLCACVCVCATLTCACCWHDTLAVWKYSGSEGIKA